MNQSQILESFHYNYIELGEHPEKKHNIAFKEEGLILTQSLKRVQYIIEWVQGRMAWQQGITVNKPSMAI